MGRDTPQKQHQQRSSAAHAAMLWGRCYRFLHSVPDSTAPFLDLTFILAIALAGAFPIFVIQFIALYYLVDVFNSRKHIDYIHQVMNNNGQN